MTTFVILLAFLMSDDAEQLRTYFEPISLQAGFKETKAGEHIGYSCDVYPKTLMVGDRMYIQVAGRSNRGHSLEYTLDPYTLGCDSFQTTVSIERNSVTAVNEGSRQDYIVVRGSPPPDYFFRQQQFPRKELRPGETLVSNVRPFFMPTPAGYDSQFWAWNDSDKDEKMLMEFWVELYTFHKEVADDSVTERRFANGIKINQEVLIKPRPKEELQLIKEWHDKIWWFSFYGNVSYPLASKQWRETEWQELEEKLTPGTLRNYVRMFRTLREVVQDENKGKHQALFNENVLKWINELHPLEKKSLTETAYRLIDSLQGDGSDIKIFVPVEFTIRERLRILPANE